jgi:Predicted membrane protein
MAPLSMIKNKLLSQILCVVIYIISFYVAFILTPESIESIWLKILIWHLYATLFIYIGSVILNNSSLYDPFWSVAPVPIVIYLADKSDNSITLDLLVLFPIIFWAARLTRNWIISWRGFEHEDFRYIDLKNTNRLNAEFRNFFGIHLFPTLNR